MMTLFPRRMNGCGQVAGIVGRRAADGGDRARADGETRMLLMDEPSMGLAPMVVEQVFETIRAINAQGVTILLVEQNALMALSIADFGYVLESGRMLLDGPARDLLHDDRVKAGIWGDGLSRIACFAFDATIVASGKPRTIAKGRLLRTVQRAPFYLSRLWGGDDHRHLYQRRNRMTGLDPG